MFRKLRVDLWPLCSVTVSRRGSISSKELAISSKLLGDELADLFIIPLVELAERKAKVGIGLLVMSLRLDVFDGAY